MAMRQAKNLQRNKATKKYHTGLTNFLKQPKVVSHFKR